MIATMGRADLSAACDPEQGLPQLRNWGPKPVSTLVYARTHTPSESTPLSPRVSERALLSPCVCGPQAGIGRPRPSVCHPPAEISLPHVRSPFRDRMRGTAQERVAAPLESAATRSALRRRCLLLDLIIINVDNAKSQSMINNVATSLHLTKLTKPHLSL